MNLLARHYRTGETVVWNRESGPLLSIQEQYESLPWIAPAIFDLQINGCKGIAFNSPELTVDQVRQVVDVCRLHGIGGLLPTLITNSFESLFHGFKTLQTACKKDPLIARSVPGFHLEGPYISPEDGPRGAHPKDHVRRPNWEEFQRLQDAAEGKIRLVTLAPEYPEALGFIQKLVDQGIVVAIGHTSATSQRIREAIQVGAKLSTHLGNGCHAMLSRHDNYLWEQLAADELWASIIPDGHHLPARVLKSFVRAKTPSRCIITCDASSLAGLPPGRYAQWGTELEVLRNGKVIVPGTPFLAGSGVFTDHCIDQIIKLTGIRLDEAIDMATIHPTELLKLPKNLSTWMTFDWSPGEDFRVREIVE
jgi:N-acetylglucosamine-6-phosphate deacetylase